MREENIIVKLPGIISKSREKAEELINEKTTVDFYKEYISRSTTISGFMNSNFLYHCNNIDAIKDLLKKGYKNKIDLVYIDPPFFTMADYKSRIEVLNKDKKEVIEYNAYNDKWNGLSEYLEMLTIRLYLIRELLSDKGTIYVHLDFRTVHYVKMIMDYIFGMDNFINEIIWSYKSGGTSKRYFSRKHDNILAYSKTNEYIFNPQKEKSYNRGYKPYRFKGVKEYKDELGWYTLVNLKDVWQIDMVGRTSKERVGYGTQKPEALLERIILSSSNEDSLVADFFAGSGTTAVVANKHNRRFIVSDMGDLSIAAMKKRFADNLVKDCLILSNITNDNRGELTFKSIDKSKLSNGEYFVNIKLDKYYLDTENLALTNKYYKIVNDILKNDSLALIDYLGIGVQPEGENPLIIYEKYRNSSTLKIDSNLEVCVNEGFTSFPLYLKVIDIFGNTNIKVFDKY